METRFSAENQLLLETFRLFEQARGKYYEYLQAITERDGKPEQFEEYAKTSDKIWDPVRESLSNKIESALYEWANATEERKEI